MPSISSDHNGLKLESKKTKPENFINIWRLNKYTPEQSVKEKNQKKIFKILILPFPTVWMVWGTMIVIL